jgi:hypothetical protein
MNPIDRESGLANNTINTELRHQRSHSVEQFADGGFVRGRGCGHRLDEKPPIVIAFLSCDTASFNKGL